MSETFFTADWHLGETRLELLHRPFDDAQQAIDVMVANHNKVVHANDRVIVNGDVLYKDADVALYLPMIERFNGRKTLIRGNHDRHITDEQFKPYFEQIVAEGSGLELDVASLNCYVTHYPTGGKVSKFNLVGHIHSAWKVQLNMLNVGVDVHHFRPVHSGDVPKAFRAIKEFYDDDVWVAYRLSNCHYRGLRGKPGTYFS